MPGARKKLGAEKFMLPAKLRTRPIPSARCELPEAESDSSASEFLCRSTRGEAFARLKETQIEELAVAVGVGQRSEAGNELDALWNPNPFLLSFRPACSTRHGKGGAGRVFRFSTPLPLQIDSGVAASMASVITPNTQRMRL